MLSCMRKIIIFKASSGKSPFGEWINKLQKANIKAARKILDKIDRLAVEASVDVKALQGHRPIMEIRVNAYRVYCVIEGQKLIILLCGGDKGSQAKDIERASRYWDEYTKQH